MAFAVLVHNEVALASLIGPHLDEKAFGKLTTVCRFFHNWRKHEGRTVRLRLNDPAIGLAHHAPTPHVLFQARGQDEPMLTVVGTGRRQMLKIQPVAVSEYVDPNGKPVREVLPWGSGVDVDKTDCEVVLVNHETGAVEDTLVEKNSCIGHTTPSAIQFRIDRLSKHCVPRAAFRVRATVSVALVRNPDHPTLYVAESDPLQVVSHIPTEKSIAYSHRRKKRRHAPPAPPPPS